MTSTAERVLTAALDLDDEDRLELIEALISSCQSETEPPFDDSWRDVIRRRSAELRSGLVTPIPWAEIKGQAREIPGA